MCKPQTPSEQAAKARGEGPEKTPSLDEAGATYAEGVNRSRDIFLAILGHDLRAPLQAVSMSTELLLRKAALEDDALKCAINIQRSTGHLAVMVGDLLELVRSRLGKRLPIEPAPMDMADAAWEAIAQACAGQPECDPTLDVQGDTRGAWDPRRLDQMLQNLIGNALQHGSSKREVKLTLKGETDSVRLTVHNDGAPIPSDAIPTIFDPLVRSASEELGEPTTSLGLGLFIVKEVVDAHEGTIEVSSHELDGTTFTVDLPRKV